MTKKFLFIFALMLFAPTNFVSAQSIVSTDGNRPSWISNVRHRPTLETNDLIVISANGRTLSDARNDAMQKIRAAQNNVIDRSRGESFGGDTIVHYRVIAEHQEHRGGGYNLWQLVQISKRPGVALEPIPQNEFTRIERTTVGMKPFVPGMAQIHRGDNVAGTLFIVGVSALSVGAVSAEFFRADYNDKVNTTFNVAQRQQYIDNAETWQNTRNILIASAGAVYIWNIIDGYVGGGRGARQASNSDLRIMPFANSQGGGVFISFNF